MELFRTAVCEAPRNGKREIVEVMTVPLIQGTLRYTYITGPQGSTTPK